VTTAAERYAALREEALAKLNIYWDDEGYPEVVIRWGDTPIVMLRSLSFGAPADSAEDGVEHLDLYLTASGQLQQRAGAVGLPLPAEGRFDITSWTFDRDAGEWGEWTGNRDHGPLHETSLSDAYPDDDGTG
jgi:hypothetical protein